MLSSPRAFYRAALDRAFAISFALIVVDKPIVGSQSSTKAGSWMFERSAGGLGKNFLARALAFP